MTTPFGIRHVSSTTAGSCASPGRSAQKLYLYAFGMLPCTMMNNKIGTSSGTSNTHVRWASTTYVRIPSHHRGKRKCYQKYLLNRSCRTTNPRHILPIRSGRQNGVVTSRYSLGTLLFTNYDTTARLALSLSLSLLGVLARPRATGVTSHLRRGEKNASQLAHLFKLDRYLVRLRAKIQIIIIVYT